MKVLRVIGSMNPASGGPCQGIRNSIPEMEQIGVDNEVVCLDGPNPEYIGKDAFLIHPLGSGKGPWNYSTNLIPWLMENLHRFDAVIVHGLWLYHSYAVSKAIKQLKAQNEGKKVPKFFVMPHGMLDPYFQKASGRKLKAIRNWVYWKLIESRVVNEADGVLFTCEAELQLAREPFHPYHPKREINVGYGIINPPTLSPSMRDAFLEKCPELKNQPYLLFLSRIHEKKGVDLLIKAYAEVIRNFALKETAASFLTKGEVNITNIPVSKLPKLVIAGPGLETSYGTILQKLVAESEDLKDCIFFPGMLTGEAKWGAFYSSEAFILPSHQENFGIAVAEALACKKPVLISNQVNIWREIKKAGGGIIADDSLTGVKKLLEAWFTLTDSEKSIMSEKALFAYKTHFAIGPAATNLIKALEGEEV